MFVLSKLFNHQNATIMKIQIEESALRKILAEALQLAEGHPGNFTSGWGYPIYVNEAGKLSIGGMISDNSCPPDAIEVIRVKNWNVDDNNEAEYSDDWTREDEVESVIDIDLVDHYMDKVFSIIQDKDADAAMGEGSGCEYEII